MKTIGLVTLTLAAITMAAITGYVKRGEEISAAEPFEIHYAPTENLERLDVGLIGTAGETIDMAAYVLTDVAVIEALTSAAERGVKVRIWRESETAAYGDAAASELAKLAAAGAELRVKPPGDLMHLKSYCVDGLTLRTGAANFSASGEKRQDNDLAVIRSRAACAGFEANFTKLWGEK
jgi:phosphatidylserine/phosphatidylglycerophosphate/cardiolipin synthase-like enzyme